MNQNTGATTVEDECSRSHSYIPTYWDHKSHFWSICPWAQNWDLVLQRPQSFSAIASLEVQENVGQFLNCFTGISAVMEKMRLQPSPPAVHGAESISVIPTQMKCNSLHHGYCPPFLQQAQNPTGNQTPGHVEAQRGKKVRAIWHDWMLFYYRFFGGLCSWVSLTQQH